jgi:hypothetical protein
MAAFRHTGTDMVLVVERYESPQTHMLDPPLKHDHGQMRFPGFPAHGGPHLHPIEAFWQVRKTSAVLDDGVAVSNRYPSAHAGGP